MTAKQSTPRVSAEWQKRAACRGMGLELFFGPGRDREGPHTAVQREAAVIAFCKTECPVLTECLVYALKTGSKGIWGGKTESERQSYRKTKAGKALLAEAS
ncbi:WhiB family transcriptional regulator [Planomonospora sp. ID67723]|uniref:WhiB family transcriptional regulator n=1 Tax=Planomonospora sp. ID67723 TaxID=2738134 RepID=UPI0018C3FBB5|nr:WhiB family transcriptional regulator [Planomonospora sp. ID67723]MBG0828512.1 WhiB family transcriptional regulator [Planomonospora sp. ID67723]